MVGNHSHRFPLNYLLTLFLFSLFNPLHEAYQMPILKANQSAATSLKEALKGHGCVLSRFHSLDSLVKVAGASILMGRVHWLDYRRNVSLNFALS